MPHQVTANISANVLGQAFNQDVSTTGDMGIPFSPTVTKAWAGTLTARVDNDTGTVTITDAAHTILTGDIVDVYFQDATTLEWFCHRSMTVGTVAGTSVPIDAGLGDNLPALNAAVIVAVQHYEDCVVTGNNVTSITFSAGSVSATLILRGAAGAEVAAVVLDPNTSYVWTDKLGLTNPLAGGSVLTASFSHADTVNDLVMPGCVTYN